MKDDLFSPAEIRKSGPQIFSVTEITRSVRAALEERLGVVWVEGEISNHRKQASGHQYFTLKDEQAQLSCVLFARPGMWKKHIPLSDGMCVQVRGPLTVYEARGQYQMNVQLVQAAGEGLLQAKFEALKRKLDAEGLFDPARKRMLPPFPRTIAIVTSPTGAALRDMLHILTRRAPWLRVIISPVRVQGEGAAAEIAEAVVRLNRWEELRVEVIVLARGGGSAEDLWQFNEEALARVIAGSGIPIISAVGHEIDFTISDFVADLRAPTPSAAAELVAPDATEVRRRLQSYASRMHREVSACLQKQRSRLEYLSRGALVREPRHLLEAPHRDSTLTRMHFTGRCGKESLSRTPEDCKPRRRPSSSSADHLLALRRQQVATLRRAMTERAQQALARRLRQVHRVGEMLRLLSPEATLDRGYTITTDEAGAVIRQAAAVVSGTKLRTRFQDGAVKSTAE
jgi:exodeoxyribonuclease VII large subunit